MHLMPSLAAQLWWPVAVCLGLVGLAVLSDLRRRRVPNLLVLLTILSGLGWRWWSIGALGVLSGAASIVAVVALLWLPWSAGGLGGGDVKLAAAVGSWFGLELLPELLLLGAVAGGLLAGLTYAFCAPAVRAQMRGNLWAAFVLRAWPAVRAHSGRVSVPYTGAIWLATAACWWLPAGGWW
jgi:prepilin peptidase CpaA